MNIVINHIVKQKLHFHVFLQRERFFSITNILSVVDQMHHTTAVQDLL